jgi:hypothetical protein
MSHGKRPLEESSGAGGALPPIRPCLVIKGKGIQTMHEIEGSTYVDCACFAGLPPTSRPQGPESPMFGVGN